MFFTLLGLLLFTNVSADPKVLYAEFSDTDSNGSNETMTLKCGDTTPSGAYAYSNGWSSLSGNNNISQNDIVNVFVDGSCANYDGTDLQFLFSYFTNLTTITDLTNLNTNSVVSMQSMFESCPKLTSLDLSSFNTSNVTDMNSMFAGCSSLVTIYVSRGWTTDNVSDTNGDNMFAGCSNLVGENGSTVGECGNTDKTYARIDGGTSHHGYFREKNSIIRLGNNIDNSSIVKAFDGLTNAKVELIGRTLNKDKWNTLCVPFDISDPAAVFGAGTLVKTLSGYSVSGSTVTISFTDANSIEAGKPYIVMPTTNITNPVFNDVTINKIMQDVIISNAATFKGNYAPVPLSANDTKKLFLANNMLYYPTGSVTVKPFRAYFELTSDVPTASGAPNLVIDFGETTGVGKLRIENRRIKNSFYDLQGRRLNGKPTQKGIYIHHGKLEVLK